jgi:hypothetical protein
MLINSEHKLVGALEKMSQDTTFVMVAPRARDLLRRVFHRRYSHPSASLIHVLLYL